jgi:hypothetical protein
MVTVTMRHATENKIYENTVFMVHMVYLSIPTGAGGG